MELDEGLPLLKMALRRGVDGNGRNERPHQLWRTTSCVGEPKVSVLEALEERNHQLLSDLLAEKDLVDVNHPFEERKCKTLLHLAVDLDDLPAVRMILARHPNVNQVNPVLKMTTLHAAARQGNPKVFHLLLESGADVNALTGSDGSSCLHILAKRCKAGGGHPDGEGGCDWKYIRCLQLALGIPGVQVDRKDKTGETASSIAVKETGNLAVLRILVRMGGADLTPLRHLIAQRFGEEKAAELVELSLLGCGSDPSAAASWLDTFLKDDLRRMLDEAEARESMDNVDEFSRTLTIALTRVGGKGPLVSNLTSGLAPGERNLLQVAADYGLWKHVKVLVEALGDPDACAEGTPPALMLAASAGHHEVVKVLGTGPDRARFDCVDPRDSTNVLHAILRKPLAELSPAEDADHDRYEECLKVLTSLAAGDESGVGAELHNVVNGQDLIGNTALHYATQQWSQRVVRMLLELGANVGIENRHGEVPINHILPDTMEAFLDEFCLVGEGNVTNDNFKITAKFHFVAPPVQAQLRQGHREAAATSSSNKVGNKGDHEDHRVIEEGDNEEGDPAGLDDGLAPETEGLWHMSRSKKHQHLLKHPVIALFLWMKWQRLSSTYNRNLIFYTLFVAVLTAFIFTLYGGSSIGGRLASRPPANGTGQDPLASDGSGDVAATALWYCLVVLLAVLVFRELLQLGVAPRRYFFGAENILEVTLIGLTAALLSGGDGLSVEARRHISAVAIVLSWAELITMVGKHPRLTTYNIYVTMFYKVLWTFIMFLLWYCLFIVAFGLGFYILLHKDHGDRVEAEGTAEGGEEEYKFFDDLGLALVKTFTMFVGELEFSDLPIETGAGYLYLLAFVFLIVVVMMNLLNGLAVSDTGAIRYEAEVHAHKCQVEIASYIESMLLGDPFNFLASWPSYVWLRRLPNCSPIGGLYRVPGVRKAVHGFTRAKEILLFCPEGPLNSRTMSFYPNKDSFKCSSLFCGGASSSSSSQVPPEHIVDSAKDVVIAQRKRGHQDVEDVALMNARLARIEDQLSRLLKQMTARVIDHQLAS